MDKSQIRILLVEDDSTVGRSIEQLIQRDGYTVDWLQSPQQVERQTKLHDYHLAIIDALLPVTNGVELGEIIHKETQGTTKVLFMSGIFKDKGFIKDALTRIPAIGFLTKPIDSEELLSIIKQQTAEYLPDAKPPLQDLFLHDSISNTIKIEAINSSDPIHGYELPWIYSLLCNSNLSGKLTLEPPEGEPWTVSFADGRIVEIENNNAESFFGRLLIEHGYTSQQEVKAALGQKSKKRLGQRLVDANAISPHVTKIIQTEQLNIRLSQSMANEHYKVKFVQGEINLPDDDAHINKLQITLVLNDLLQSKVGYDWLKSYMTPMFEHCLEPAENFDNLEGLSRLDLLKKFNKIDKIVNGKTSLSTILSVNAQQEEQLLKAVYLMLLERVCKFTDKKASKVSEKAKIARLKKILADVESQNYFEILGVTKKSPLNSINKAYHELAKVLHPDKIKKSASPKVIELTEKIFAKITEAYTILKHHEKRVLYIKELEIGQSEAIFQAEALLDLGKKSLESRRYLEALKIFEELKDSSHPPPDTYVYYIWAKLKAGISANQRKEEIEQMSRLLKHIPAEDRHSAQYFYAKALLFIAIENYDRALRCIENSLAIYPGFIAAKRDELRIRRVLEKQAEALSAKTFLMDMDLTTLFKKKKAK